MSRNENLLESILDVLDGGDIVELMPPESREEVLLQAVYSKTAALVTVGEENASQLAAIAPDSSGTSDPTTSTVGVVKQRYLNTTTGALFVCTAVAGSVYTWAAVGDLTDYRQLTKSDFMGNSAPWTAFSVGVGTSELGGTAKHPGFYTYKSHASNANSGYCHYILNPAFVISGGLKLTMVFCTGAVINGVTRRIGLHNAANHTNPTNGIYGRIVDGVLTGETCSNATGSNLASTTGSSYTLSQSTWYRLVIEINADGTAITYTLYADDSTTVLWTDAVSTTIPTGGIGYYDTCTLALPSKATNIGGIDYLDIYVPSARRLA